jgi:4'-phosphopantetheinyl transferase EntD
MTSPVTTRVLEQDLAAALAHLGPPGILLGFRLISPGDENALLAGEATYSGRRALSSRRQSGAARIVARQLLSKFGIHQVVIATSERGAPIWPAGFVGSLAHDAHIAVAAAASSDDFLGLGIDVEPAEPLPKELIDAVATPTERWWYAKDVLQSRVLFAIKEAAYKATNPLDGTFLGFQDVTVDLRARKAYICNGRIVDFVITAVPRIVTLAYLRSR